MERVYLPLHLTDQIKFQKSPALCSLCKDTCATRISYTRVIAHVNRISLDAFARFDSVLSFPPLNCNIVDKDTTTLYIRSKLFVFLGGKKMISRWRRDFSITTSRIFYFSKAIETSDDRLIRVKWVFMEKNRCHCGAIFSFRFKLFFSLRIGLQSS